MIIGGTNSATNRTDIISRCGAISNVMIFLLFISDKSQLTTLAPLTLSRCSASENSSAIVSPFASGLLWIKDYKGNTMAFPSCGGSARRQGDLPLPTNTPEEPIMIAQRSTAAIQHPLYPSLGYADGFAVTCHEQPLISQQVFNHATRDSPGSPVMRQRR